MVSKEVSPYEMPLPKYKGYLDDINSAYLTEVRNTLSLMRDFLLENGFCAVVVGSDGKRERHPQSRTEVVYLQYQKKRNEITPKQINEKFFEIYGIPYSSVFDYDLKTDGDPRVLYINEDILSYVSRDSGLIYPDRILNSRIVFGEMGMWKSAREKVLEEMGLTTGLSGKIRKALKSQIKDYLKTCETGLSRGKVCFNQGYQFYDESELIGNFGFKYGFIRLLQRDLDLKTQTLIRDRVWSTNQAMELPTNTAERVCFFDEYNQDTTLAYLWFLQRYHEVQEMYKNRRIPSVSKYDSYEFQQCSEIILRNGDSF